MSGLGDNLKVMMGIKRPTLHAHKRHIHTGPQLNMFAFGWVDKPLSKYLYDFTYAKRRNCLKRAPEPPNGPTTAYI